MKRRGEKSSEKKMWNYGKNNVFRNRCSVLVTNIQMKSSGLNKMAEVECCCVEASSESKIVVSHGGV